METLDEYLGRHRVKYFTGDELARSGSVPRALWPNMLPTVHLADLLRAAFGRTTVRSAYRGPRYNERVGGSPNSLHLTFNALDLAPESGSPDDWRNFLVSLGVKHSGGLGTYSDFVHLDTRFLVFGRTPAMWVG